MTSSKGTRSRILHFSTHDLLYKRILQKQKSLDYCYMLKLNICSICRHLSPGKTLFSCHTSFVIAHFPPKLDEDSSWQRSNSKQMQRLLCGPDRSAWGYDTFAERTLCSSWGGIYVTPARFWTPVFGVWNKLRTWRWQLGSFGKIQFVWNKGHFTQINGLKSESVS